MTRGKLYDAIEEGGSWYEYSTDLISDALDEAKKEFKESVHFASNEGEDSGVLEWFKEWFGE